MKYKIVLAITAIIFAVAGVGLYGIDTFKDFALVKDSEVLSKTREEQLSSLQQVVTPLKEQAIAAGVQPLNSNMEIAEQVKQIEGCSLLNITAQSYDSTGVELIDVLATSKIEDVAYFTDTVEAMVFLLEINDIEKMGKSLGQTVVPFDYVDIQTNNQILVLRTSTVKMNDNTVPQNNAVTSTESAFSFNSTERSDTMSNAMPAEEDTAEENPIEEDSFDPIIVPPDAVEEVNETEIFEMEVE